MRLLILSCLLCTTLVLVALPPLSPLPMVYGHTEIPYSRSLPVLSVSFLIKLLFCFTACLKCTAWLLPHIFMKVRYVEFSSNLSCLSKKSYRNPDFPSLPYFFYLVIFSEDLESTVILGVLTFQNIGVFPFFLQFPWNLTRFLNRLTPMILCYILIVLPKYITPTLFQVLVQVFICFHQTPPLWISFLKILLSNDIKIILVTS